MVDASGQQPGEFPQSPITDLFIVGAGVNFPDQLTSEALEILVRCRVVYTIVSESVIEGLPDDLRGKCVSLWSHYSPSRKRGENYREVIKSILSGIAEGGPVAWLTPGHPLIFDSVSEGLRQRASTDGFTVQTIPGISCIDTIIADVGYEPANGLLVHEATALVAHDLPLDNRIAVILLQIGVFGTEYARLTGKEDLPDLAPLRDHICRFYPPDTEVAFVRSRWNTARQGSVVWTPLCQMLEVRKQFVDGTSLFIPRADYKGLASTRVSTVPVNSSQH